MAACDVADRAQLRSLLTLDDLIAALTRKGRRDAGRQVALSEALLKVLEAQYAEHPRWSVQLHYDNLVALSQSKPDLQPLPSYTTLQGRYCLRVAICNHRTRDEDLRLLVDAVLETGRSLV